MSLENALHVPERHAAILYGNGTYQMFFADVLDFSGIPFLGFESFMAEEMGSGSNTQNLKTNGIKSCAGIMYQNGMNYVLAHAYGKSNFKELLAAVNPLSIADAKSNPLSVYLCTPNWSEDYASVIQDSFESKIQISSHNKRWFIYNSQIISIGKDIIDVGDGLTKTIIQERAAQSSFP